MIMATRKRHSPEQVVRKSTTADRLLSEGKDVAAACRELDVSEQTYHRWRNQFGGLKADDAKQLKDLERENSTLKGLLADAELKKATLQPAPTDKRLSHGVDQFPGSGQGHVYVLRFLRVSANRPRNAVGPRQGQAERPLGVDRLPATTPTTTDRSRLAPCGLCRATHTDSSILGVPSGCGAKSRTNSCPNGTLEFPYSADCCRYFASSFALSTRVVWRLISVRYRMVPNAMSTSARPVATSLISTAQRLASGPAASHCW
jgi:putative transposase